MSGFKDPQDRKHPVTQEMLNNALRLQSANILQKATMDVMGGKLILILSQMKRLEQTEINGESYAVVEGSAEYTSAAVAEEVLNEVSSILSMTRQDIAERRAAGVFEYPDVEIQAILNKAGDEIVELLKPKGNVE